MSERAPEFLTMSERAPESLSDSLVTQEMVQIRKFGSDIGGQVSLTFDLVQQFIDWMGLQQRSSRWFTAAASEFSQALRESCPKDRGDKYAKNLERTVWQVIQNPGFLFMDSNTSRNEQKNLARIQQEHGRLRVCEELESQIPPDIPVVDDTKDRLLLCSKCNKNGFIVLCGNFRCINRYHYACAGVRKEEVDDRDFYCADCDPQFLASIISKRKPNPKPNPAKKKRSRRRSVANTSKQNSSKNKSKGQAETEASGGDGFNLSERDSGGDCSEDQADDSSDDQALDSTLPSNHQKAKSADPPPANDDSQAPSSSRLRQNYDIDALRNSALPSLPKATAVLEHFFWSHGQWTVEECISTLESLAKISSDHSEFGDEYKLALAHLNNRCIAFARLYSNPEFNVLYKEASKALDDYKGAELIRSREFVETNLRQYGFFITPRMWSKLEILLIMCILLDSSLVYQHVNQKTGSARTEEKQNR
jgi:hypothetical protein